MDFKTFVTESTDIPLRTLKGSRIRRYQGNVGKDIHNEIYVHKNYMSEIVPEKILQNALKWIPKGLQYNTIAYNRKLQTVRFDEALNFDSAREPWAGGFLKVFPDGPITAGHTEFIWHHKWLWVKDDYKGFNVQESYEWSKLWLSKLTAPSGSLRVWQQQLAEVGLA